MPIHSEVSETGIATITISNPVRFNALDLAMFEELARLWPSLEDDPRVRCVVMRGEGARAFCSGADLSAHLDRREDIDVLIERALLKSKLFRKPLIAAIQGACVAGGLELALAADVRVASEDASLGLPEVRWGIVPSGGGARKLCDQIGHAKAMDLLLTGTLIDGREAERIGLVSRVVPAANVWSEAWDVAQRLADNSLNAMVATKRIAHDRRTAAYASAEAIERELVALVRKTGDPEAGKAAFLARLKPRYGSISEALLHCAPSQPAPFGP